MDHLNQTMTLLSSEGMLRDCGFIIPDRTQSYGDRLEQTITEVGLEICIDDEVADVMGQLILATVEAELQREMWLLRGWPFRMQAALKSPAEADRQIKKFKDDQNIFDEYAGIADLSTGEKQLRDRHVMN